MGYELSRDEFHMHPRHSLANWLLTVWKGMAALTVS